MSLLVLLLRAGSSRVGVFCFRFQLHLSILCSHLSPSILCHFEESGCVVETSPQCKAPMGWLQGPRVHDHGTTPRMFRNRPIYGVSDNKV